MTACGTARSLGILQGVQMSRDLVDDAYKQALSCLIERQIISIRSLGSLRLDNHLLADVDQTHVFMLEALRKVLQLISAVH